MPDEVDAYKVLQVDPEAEGEVIQAAYRRLARKYHPDLAAGPEAAGRMAAINAAGALLGTPAARAAYDRSLAGTSGATPAAPPHRAGPHPHDPGAARATGTDQTAGGPPSSAGGRPA